MSIKKDDKSKFYEILDRLHEISGKANEYEIAELLGFKKDSFAARKSRGSVPKKEIKLTCVSNGWNFDWVMSGEGSKMAEDRPFSEGFAAIGDYQSLSDPVLNEIIEILQTEPPETGKFILQLLKSRKSTREALKGLEKVGD